MFEKCEAIANAFAYPARRRYIRAKTVGRAQCKMSKILRSEMLVMLLICVLLPLIAAQYETLPQHKDQRHFQSYINRPQESSHFQYSSIGSQAFSEENNSVYQRPDSLMPYLNPPPNKQQPIRYRERLDDEFRGTRNLEEQPRNYRYHDPAYNSVNAGRQRRIDKPWQSQSPVREEYRGRQKYPRHFGSRRDEQHRFPKHYHIENRVKSFPEVKRNPRIVKYIADKNGFAVREDLLKPLQSTIERVRQESKRRVLTALPSNPAQSSSLMSQVVTSAIQVSGQPNNAGMGKFLPKIFDMKSGKRANNIDKLSSYSVEKFM